MASQTVLQDYAHTDNHTLPTYDMTSGFKPFTVSMIPCWRSVSYFQQVKHFYAGETVHFQIV